MTLEEFNAMAEESACLDRLADLICAWRRKGETDEELRKRLCGFFDAATDPIPAERLLLHYMSIGEPQELEKVVHCRDCKYCKPNNPYLVSSFGTCVWLDWDDDGMKADDFCSRGERRNDA